MRVQPSAGDAIYFHNTTPEGRVDPASVHCGETLCRQPRERGADVPVVEKWVLSKWLRTRPFEVNHAAGFGPNG